MLTYSTYLGGTGVDRGFGIAIDSAGNVYVTGKTDSTNFPTANPLQSTNGGNFDAFVTKLNANTDAFTYSTYFGGFGEDQGFRIAVDATGKRLCDRVHPINELPDSDPVQQPHAAAPTFS